MIPAVVLISGLVIGWALKPANKPKAVMSSDWPNLQTGDKEITFPNGSKHTGGTRSWRNNNPGNLRYHATGSIGHDNDGFAVFETYDAGKAALIAHIDDTASLKRTVLQFFIRYAPKSDGNDPELYARAIAQKIGASANQLIGDLTEQQRLAIADNVQRIEGYKAGATS